MSVFRHINLQSMLSYDINVSSDLLVCCTLKLLKYVFFFYYVAAVVAFEEQGVFGFDVELGFYGFVAVAYAGGVGAFDDVFDCFGQFDFLFFYDFVVADDVDCGVRGDEGDFVYFLGVEFSALDFEDVLRPVPFAGHVDGDGYGPFLAARYSEDFDHIQSVAARDVIYDCAVSDFGNSQFCFAQGCFSL